MMYRANMFLTAGLLSVTSLIREHLADQQSRLQREEGQAFVEYALVLVVISIVIGAAITWDPLTGAINGAIQNVADALGAS